MSKDQEEAFERWWKRKESAGLGLSDPFEVGVIKAVAKAAYAAGSSRQARPIGS